MKKHVLIWAVLMVLGFFSCAKGGNEKKVQVLKVAFNQVAEHPQYIALDHFGKEFEKQTNGAYKLEISPNAVLGDQRATAELVQNGTIQMAIVANPIVESFNKDFAILGLTYVYDGLDHLAKVIQSNILDDLYMSTESSGFIINAAFSGGARNVYTDRPIREPADLASHKVRVMQSETMKRMLDLMGGVGTPMSQGEVYTAIQQGVLEGGENNELIYADLKHYEVAPFYSYTQHLIVPDLVIMNSDIYSDMSDENKAIFKDLMKKAVAEELTLWDEMVLKAKKTAMDNGATFIEDVDIKAFQDRVKSLQEDVINQSAVTKKVYADIRKLAN